MTYPGPPDGGQQDPNQQPYRQPYQQPYQQQPWTPQQGMPGPGPYQQFGGPMPPYGRYDVKPLGDPGTLDLPWYGIGFGQAISRAFKKYARFDGRASRSEFWWFYLFNVIVSFILSIPYEIAAISQTAAVANGATPGLGLGIIKWEIPPSIWGLVVLLPTLGLFWRRLHDTNRSGAWWFFSFACGIGVLVPLIMCILDTNPEGRRFDRVASAPGVGPGGYRR